MGLTPHEERQIHEIEETLFDSDPGFAQRMNRLLRPQRKLTVVALCLLLVAVGVAASHPADTVVVISCTATAAFLAGWCLGRVGSVDPRWWLRRTRTVVSRILRRLCRPVRSLGGWLRMARRRRGHGR